MESATSRQAFETKLQLKLPFDDEILRYLLRVVPASDEKEVLELIKDFCPTWTREDQRHFADLMLESCQMETQKPRSLQSQTQDIVEKKLPDKYDVSRFLAEDDDDDDGEVADVSDGPVVDLAADELLARMLQDEDDQAFNQGSRQQIRGGKKKGKGYKPIPINYTVGRNAGGGGAALGMTGPSNLAEMLRTRRQQEQRPMAMHDTSRFGPPAARGNSPWAPAPVPHDGTGMTWAERAQVAAAEQNAGVEEFKEPSSAQKAPISAAPVPAGPVLRLSIQSNDTNQSFQVDAGAAECFGTVKARIEKQRSIPAARQRLLYRGRELTDAEEVRSSGVQPGHPIQLALRENSATPNVASRPMPATNAPQRMPPHLQSNPQQRPPNAHREELSIKLRLPGGVIATMNNVLASATTLSVKQRIQQEHGIRVDHLSLLFFGYALQDSSPLSDCGIADGASIDVKLTPPGLVGARDTAEVVKPQMQTMQARGQQKGTTKGKFADLQVSDHGRILSEEEALKMALEASQSSGGTMGGRCTIDDDDGDDGIDGDNSSGEDVSVSGDTEFLVEVSMQDDKLSSLIAHAKRVASSMQLSQNYLDRVSKRSGLRLTLLCRKTKKQKSLLAYTVYRFKQKALHVLQVAVVGECRGAGYGRQIVKWLIHHAKKANVDNIILSSLQDSVPFYQRLGFKRVATQGVAGEDYVEGQVCVEYICGRKRVQAVKAKRPDFSQPGASLVGGEMLRSQLVNKVFELCDVDGNGFLTAEEMLPFARETGFDGTIGDWKEEFASLCAENAINVHSGISIGHLKALVDDESDKGCYCTDQELREMVQKLERDATLRPKPKPQAKGPSGQGRLGSTREDLVRKLFSVCDVNRDGNLNSEEMRRFACSTGFDGDEQEWAHEFRQLCSEYSVGEGINLSLFQKLVDDNSDSGCYCTDSELETILKDITQTLQARKADTQISVSVSFLGGDTLMIVCDPNGTIRGLQQKLCEERVLPAGNYYKILHNGTALGDNEEIGEKRAFQAVACQQDDRAERTRLIHEVFEVCDVDCDGRLNKDEMLAFATMTGFEGDGWDLEFESLCREQGAWNGRHTAGLDLNQFTNLVEDSSDSGCYCTDDELQDMLSKLKAQLPKAYPKQEAREDARTALIKSVFLECDRDRDHSLCCEEMELFARLTGFEGTAQEWTEEFKILCSEMGLSAGVVAISEALFSDLVNDQSENGQYCTDEQLVDMLKSLKAQAASKVATANVTLPDSTQTFTETHQSISLEQPEVASLTASGKADNGRRVDLVHSVFQLCDLDGDGYLLGPEMLPFARQTGFDGSEQDWQGEYELLCAESGADPRKGVDVSRFAMLVDDDSDNGCYCSDEELAAMISALQEIQVSRIHEFKQERQNEGRPAVQLEPVKPVGSLPSRPPPGLEDEVYHVVEQDGSANNGRESLLKSVFDKCDEDADGFLSIMEMYTFATAHGISCSPQQWAEEYAGLCKEHRCCVYKGMDFRVFENLANDNRRNNYYCSDRSLQDLAKQVVEIGVPTQNSAIEVIELLGRVALVRSVFRFCDADRDGVLSCAEMLTYARQAGFDGSPEEWEAEFETLCLENHIATVGINFDSFVRLANDESDNGCFCADSELLDLLKTKAPGNNGLTRSHAIGDIAPVGREDLINAAFRACDADGDGFLTEWEMYDFSKHTGFDGSDAEWSKEYVLLCRENDRNPSVGVEPYLFSKLVNDQSDNGCYCTDDELKEMIKALFSVAKQRASGKR